VDRRRGTRLAGLDSSIYFDQHRTVWPLERYKEVVGSKKRTGEEGPGWPRSELAQRSDDELLIEIGAGDKESLEQLYRRHGPHMAALLTSIYDDHQLAEEVVQDTFLAVWNGARFAGRSRVRTWLVAIAIRQVKSRRRKHRFSVGNQSTDRPSADPGPESVAIASLETDRLVDELSDLTRVQREVLLLAVAEEMTQAEIAEALGVRLGTVKSRMHGAKSAMKRKWEHGDRK
jgi:RNA polymerase sigma factor (sigma-70 family)